MARAAKPGQAPNESPGDFLARWSRRKIEAREEAARPDDADTVITQPAGADVPQAQERVLTDADMPPVETLDAESDFSPFMSTGVSDGLRQQALRILFRQPAYNVTDGLNDYDGDYTQFAGLGSVVTHEMKRMLKRELEAEKDRPAREDARARESRPAAADAPADTPADPSPDASRTAATGQPDRETDDATGKDPA